jgi:hypothetical protein
MILSHVLLYNGYIVKQEDPKLLLGWEPIFN